MKTFLCRKPIAQLCAAIVLTAAIAAQAAQSGGYRTGALVADQSGAAKYTDPRLLNPWGLINWGGLLAVANNHSGLVTFYNRGGRPQQFDISIPSPAGGPGPVTDLGLNHWGRSFMISDSGHQAAAMLLFVTEEGTIAGWNPRVNKGDAVVVVTNNAAGASYKSMALGGAVRHPLLYVANFGQGQVDVFDATFKLMKSFTDSELAAASYVPFGIHNLGSSLFVTFAFKASPTDGDETAGPGLGYVDEFDWSGNLVRRFASQGTLNAPWAVVRAPRHFGQFSGALLVGNFGDGTINAYDARSAAFLGQLSDATGAALQLEGLWDLSFAGNVLYYTAGPNDENNGRLGYILAQSMNYRSSGGYHY